MRIKIIKNPMSFDYGAKIKYLLGHEGNNYKHECEIFNNIDELLTKLKERHNKNIEV